MPKKVLMLSKTRESLPGNYNNLYKQVWTLSSCLFSFIYDYTIVLMLKACCYISQKQTCQTNTQYKNHEASALKTKYKQIIKYLVYF